MCAGVYAGHATSRVAWRPNTAYPAPATSPSPLPMAGSRETSIKLGCGCGPVECSLRVSRLAPVGTTGKSSVTRKSLVIYESVHERPESFKEHAWKAILATPTTDTETPPIATNSTTSVDEMFVSVTS